MRLNYAVSLSRTFGTVFIERVFDLFAIVLLGLAAGFWSFRSGMSPAVQLVFGIGLVVLAGLAIGLYTVRNFGSRIIRRLPLPHRVVEFYDRFEEGVFSIEARRMPVLALLTVLIWATEGLRLYFVMQELGVTSGIGISGAFFVALIASLLTAVPFTAGRAWSRWVSTASSSACTTCPTGGGGGRARRPRDQRAVDHHLRQHRLRPVRQDQGPPDGDRLTPTASPT